MDWAAPIHPNDQSPIMDGFDSSMGKFRFGNYPILNSFITAMMV